MLKSDAILQPEWPVPSCVKSLLITRQGNFDLHDQDPSHLESRDQLSQALGLNKIQFLKQVHGTRVVDLSSDHEFEADAAYTNQIQEVCAVLTADCLPLLVCNSAGTEVAAIHAGWRGLLSGVINETIKKFKSPPEELFVWLGPAIGPCHFEINEEMQKAFLSENAAYEAAFHVRDRRLYGDLYQLARLNLNSLGVTKIYGGDYCSYCNADLFYSYRRDQGKTGRMASLIWIEAS